MAISLNITTNLPINKLPNNNVKHYYEKAETKLQDAVNIAVEDIQSEITELLNGNLVQTFIACLDKNINVSAQNIDNGMDTERLFGQVNWLKNIGEQVGVKLVDSATRGVLIPLDKVFFALGMLQEAVYIKLF